MSDDYAWKSRMSRAFTQRIYLMHDQSRMVSENNFHFKVMGNTDNAYNVIIDTDSVSCSCPDHSTRGNFCKHLMFILIRAIGMPPAEVQRDYCQACQASQEDEEYQTSQSTLRHCARYFENRQNAAVLVAAPAEGVKRKLLEDDDDCPICCESFAETADEATVWCQTSCGKSIHQACFAKWRKASRNAACVYCRAPWK